MEEEKEGEGGKGRGGGGGRMRKRKRKGRRSYMLKKISAILHELFVSYLFFENTIQ